MLKMQTKEVISDYMDNYPKITEYLKLTKAELDSLHHDSEGEILERDIDSKLYAKLQEFDQATDVASESYVGEEPIATFMELGHDVGYFEEAYNGAWDSEVEYAEYLIDSCYDLEKMMGSLSSYFDYEKFAHDLFISDYSYSNGYVFNNYY